jgi:hypothetical protein
MKVAELHDKIKEWEKELDKWQSLLQNINSTKREEMIKDHIHNIKRHLKMLNYELDKEIL